MFFFCLLYLFLRILFNGDMFLKKNIKKILIGSIPLIVGLISTLFVDFDLYNKINLPNLAPPAIIFPIMWTILYILMGSSLLLILKDGNTKDNKILFLGQLVLNFIWVLVFFKFKLFLLSFIIIVALDIIVFYTILVFKNYNKLSSYLLIPYLVWICFASYLNWMIYILN